MEDVKYVLYNGSKYAIFSVKYKKLLLPGLLDHDDYLKIKKLNKNWRCNDNGFIVCSHTIDGVTKDVHMHEIVMLLHHNKQKKKIIHINRIGLDNRSSNLMYDDVGKMVGKNVKKKERSTNLPKGCGIDPNDIPTYIWYVNQNGTSGARFVVKIGDVHWSTTSCKDVDLKTKLEYAKQYLRDLFSDRDDLCKEYSMNGDYNEEGKKLLNSYYDIVKYAGYDYIKKFIPEGTTKELLLPS